MDFHHSCFQKKTNTYPRFKKKNTNFEFLRTNNLKSGNTLKYPALEQSITGALSFTSAYLVLNYINTEIKTMSSILFVYMVTHNQKNFINFQYIIIVLWKFALFSFLIKG